MNPCLPALTAASKWIWRKPGGVARNDEVDTGVEHFLIRIEAGELTIHRHIELVAERLREVTDAAVETVFKQIAHGDELVIARGGHAVVRRARPTTPQPIKPIRSTTLPAHELGS